MDVKLAAIKMLYSDMRPVNRLLRFQIQQTHLRGAYILDPSVLDTEDLINFSKP